MKKEDLPVAPVRTRCSRCGKAEVWNWREIMCRDCDTFVNDIRKIMSRPETRPMTDQELEIIVAKSGRTRGVFVDDFDPPS